MAGAARAIASGIAAVVAGLPVAFFFGALGLLVREDVHLWLGFPTTFLATGIVAALAASWAANAASRDGTRTRLGLAVAWGALAGLAGAVVFLVLFLAAGAFRGPPVGTILLPVAAVVALVPAQAVLRQRQKARPLGRDALWSVVVVVLVAAAWYGVVGVACLLDACGA